MMRNSRLLPVICVLLLASTVGFTHPRPFYPVRTPCQLPTDRSPELDVISYNLDITISPGEAEISGTATIDLRVTEDSLEQITLDLVALDVYSVLEEGDSVAFSRTGDEVVIYPEPALVEGDPRTFVISYGGHPIHEAAAWGGFFFSGDRAFSIGVGLESTPPWMGRYWFPSHDVPADKVTCEVKLRVPEGWYGVSNGQLLQDETQDTLRVTTWGTDFPIATYLMFIAAGPYIEIADDSGPVPIRHYVRPSEEDAARRSFERVPQMIDTFIDRYGPYPFERFGFISVQLSGAMEHQTCVAYGSSLINGTLSWESLTAHELSHMWWGDCVTYADWTQIYLAEGFATYSEAIWAESLGGLAAYRQSMYTMMTEYLGSGEWYFPLDEPDILWGYATYEKGACMVHMLRQVLGDSLFFNGLARYRSDHEYGIVTTDSLEMSFEAATGMELTWFFDQWIRSPGHPELAFRWSTYDYQNGDVGLDIEVSQIQDIGPVFRFPFEISCDLEDTTLWVSFEDSLQVQVAQFRLPGDITTVHYDPHHNLLFRHRGSQYADRLTLYALELTDLGDGDGGLDPGENAEIVIELSNSMSALGGGTLELITTDPDIVILSGTATIDSIPSGGTSSNESEPFLIRAGNGTGGDVELTARFITEDQAIITVPIVIHVGIAQRLLVVDDIRNNGYEHYFTSAMDTLPDGNNREVWRINVQGPPSPDRLSKYASQGMMVWYTGDADSMALSASECTAIMQFLDQGGLLFLTGQNALDDLGLHAPGQTFMQDYLRISMDNPNSSITRAVEGVEGDYIGNDIAGVIQGDGGANNQTSLTVISPLVGSDPVMYYFHHPELICATRAEDPGKVVLLSFGFEAIYQTQPHFLSREQLIRRVADWLEGPGTLVDVRPTSTVLSITMPEPFYVGSVITLILSEPADADLALYDLGGRRVKAVFEGMLPLGNAKIGLPERPAAGVYLFRGRIGKDEIQTPMVILP